MCNLHTLRITCFTCTSQRFLVNLPSYATITTKPSFRTFPSLQGSLLITPKPENDYRLVRFKRLKDMKKEVSTHLLLLPIQHHERNSEQATEGKSEPSCLKGTYLAGLGLGDLETYTIF